MKTVFFLFVFFFIQISSFCQNYEKKRPLVGVNYFLIDFKTPDNIAQAGLGEYFHADLKSMTSGISFNYLKGISDHFDYVITGSGCFVNYSIKDRPVSNKKDLLLEITGTSNVKLNSDKSLFSPFVALGIGISKFKNYYGLFIPIGLGFQLNFHQDIYFFLQTQNRTKLTSKVDNNFFHSLGIAGSIRKKHRVPVKKLPIIHNTGVLISDRDGDGIIDAEDSCPDSPGPMALKGCPDMDNDGIPDINDKCPTIYGLTKYFGCPIPDSDSDGINDEEDSCPTEKGLLKYNGCPPTDKDMDGVDDEKDNCPDIFGSLKNNGCPELDSIAISEIEKQSKNIFFITGSATLVTKSFNSLNLILDILSSQPHFNITIDGHTDNVGDSIKNQLLSERRANAVKDYFISKGLASNRIAVYGYGQTKPINGNSSDKDRSENRRVELKIDYK